MVKQYVIQFFDQEMEVFNISNAREWSEFKEWFDKTFGGHNAPDIL